mmetsp:Transcript_35288/g.108925  ORF Transcript_35288/g.108925 Transcript_35288/m.108925 type:complete len:394 (-) Transcript_35288:247-1428(-)
MLHGDEDVGHRRVREVLKHEEPRAGVGDERALGVEDLVEHTKRVGAREVERDIVRVAAAVERAELRRRRHAADEGARAVLEHGEAARVQRVRLVAPRRQAQLRIGAQLLRVALARRVVEELGAVAACDVLRLDSVRRDAAARVLHDLRTEADSPHRNDLTEQRAREPVARLEIRHVARDTELRADARRGHPRRVREEGRVSPVGGVGSVDRGRVDEVSEALDVGGLRVLVQELVVAALEELPDGEAGPVVPVGLLPDAVPRRVGVHYDALAGLQGLPHRLVLLRHRREEVDERQILEGADGVVALLDVDDVERHEQEEGEERNEDDELADEHRVAHAVAHEGLNEGGGHRRAADIVRERLFDLDRGARVAGSGRPCALAPALRRLHVQVGVAW